MHTHNMKQYKYQVNIDGTVAAYRLPYLLAGGSLVLKQDSSYYEHFYHQLEPWVHYVPLHRNISDTHEKVLWAKENDEEAKKIATNSALFVRHNLLPEHLYCYIIHLLKVCSAVHVLHILLICSAWYKICEIIIMIFCIYTANKII